MIGIFNSISVNSVEIFRPSDMVLKREDVLKGQYETCTGKRIGDWIGWRYSDTELVFDTLTDEMLQALVSATGEFTITFTDSDGEHTEAVYRNGFGNTATRFTLPNGKSVWKDITMKISFIDVHTE